jgi:hypothetical protein
MKAILLMLGALSAAIIFVGCGTAVGRATGVDTEESYDLMEQEYEEKKKGYAITYSFEVFNECASIGAPQNLDLMSPELGLQENGQWVKDAIIEWENELLEKLNTCMNDKGAYGTIEYDGKPSETWVNRPLNPNDFFSGPGGPGLYPPILNGEYSTNFRFVSSEDDVLKTMESPQFLDKYENNIQTLTIAFNSQIAALEEKRLEEERRQKEEEERVASQIQEAIEQAAAIESAIETCQTDSKDVYIRTMLEAREWEVPTMLEAQEDDLAQEREKLGREIFQECIENAGVEVEYDSSYFEVTQEDVVMACAELIAAPGCITYISEKEALSLLAEQAEELAEEEAPVDGTPEERIAALEERVAELTELIIELTEALQPN